MVPGAIQASIVAAGEEGMPEAPTCTTTLHTLVLGAEEGRVRRVWRRVMSGERTVVLG